MVGCAKGVKNTTENIVLTEEQKKVKILNNDPATNRKLREECHAIAVEFMANIIQLRIIASRVTGSNLQNTFYEHGT